LSAGVEICEMGFAACVVVLLYVFSTGVERGAVGAGPALSAVQVEA